VSPTTKILSDLLSSYPLIFWMGGKKNKTAVAFTPVDSRTIILVYGAGGQKKEVLSLLSPLPNSINKTHCLNASIMHHLHIVL